MTTITWEQFGILLNMTGVIVPLVASVSITWYYRFPFFRHWTLAYMSMAATIPLLLLLETHGHPFGLALLTANVYFLHVDLLLRTGVALRGGCYDRRWLLASLAMWLGANAVLIATQSFVAAGIPLTLGSLFAHGYVGAVLLRLPNSQAGTTRLWLGLMMMLMGLWGLTYPLFSVLMLVWLGYAASGLLHMLVGAGMIVFLLEVVAEQLRAQNRRLEELDQMKSHFIATVSHELRTPLTIVKGATGLLQEEAVGPLEAAQAQLLGGLSVHADRLSNLVCDLLDFSRLEVGQVAFRRAPTDMAALVSERMEAARPAYARKRVTLRVASTAARTLPIDAVRIGQVLDQLLSNALKFTPEGGEVAVYVSPHEDGVRLTVRDTGRGIPPGQLDSIFTRFYQVDNTTTREADGLGLGLAICKAIVEEGHGGSIRAESKPGEGATFVVTLPARREARPALARMEAG